MDETVKTVKVHVSWDSGPYNIYSVSLPGYGQLFDVPEDVWNRYQIAQAELSVAEDELRKYTG